MTILKKAIPKDFAAPTALPASAEQTGRWQRANRTWWNSNPMRYDWTEPLGVREGSPAFYDEIDRRFFSELEQFMPWRIKPFDPLVDFDALGRWDMLEIGVGNGSHAGLFARNARSFTGIDLTDYAVKSTSGRMRCFGIDATILQMDAEVMAFRDNSFDFIWSWGVIHHSADTERVLGEMRRVLKPGGTAITMVYHRTLWNYYMMGGLIYRLAPGHPLRRSRSTRSSS